MTRTVTFTNSGDLDMTYDLGNVGGVVTGPTSSDPVGEFAPGLFVASAGATFSTPALTVPANGSASVDVTITQPTTANFFIYGGYIVATPRAGGMTLRVPYMGVTGSYQAYPTFLAGSPRMTRTPSGPALGDGAVFTLADANNQPVFVFGLAHATRTLKAEVFAAPATPGGAPGKAFHVAAQFERLARNSTPTGTFFFRFDGVTANGSKTSVVPNGSYVVVISALKPLADPSLPSSTVVWQSPTFVIARP